MAGILDSVEGPQPAGVLNSPPVPGYKPAQTLIDLYQALQQQDAQGMLANNPVAALGFDPWRLIPMQRPMGVGGDYAAGVYSPGTAQKLIRDRAETLRAPTQDVIALSPDAIPGGKDRDTLRHESIHRGIEMMRKEGVLPNWDQIIMGWGFGNSFVPFKEEDMTRLYDYLHGGKDAREETNDYFKRKFKGQTYKDTATPELMLSTSKNIQAYMMLMEKTAAAQSGDWEKVKHYPSDAELAKMIKATSRESYYGSVPKGY